MSTVISTFPTQESAEHAIQELRNKGFEKEISMVAKQDKTNQNKNNNNDGIMNGTSTGGAIGGLLGLAVGAGALAIPGLGPILAAGPIAGMLSGVATGGIAGGLVDYGIPAERGQYYEDKIKQGHMLVTVQCDQNRAQEAEQALRNAGGRDVETH